MYMKQFAEILKIKIKSCLIIFFSIKWKLCSSLLIINTSLWNILLNILRKLIFSTFSLPLPINNTLAEKQYPKFKLQINFKELILIYFKYLNNKIIKKRVLVQCATYYLLYSWKAEKYFIQSRDKNVYWHYMCIKWLIDTDTNGHENISQLQNFWK